MAAVKHRVYHQNENLLLYSFDTLKLILFLDKELFIAEVLAN